MTSARLRVGGAHLDERELVLHQLVRGDVLDLEHVDQPVELLGRLLDRDGVAVEREGHPADVLLVGPRDRQGVDVEVARPHQAGDPVEHAGPVHDEDDEDVALGLARAGDVARSGGVSWPTWAGWAGVRWRSSRSGLIPRASPRLDQVGQALARRHHREHVLLLLDLEPDERRAVDGLGGPDGRIHLVRAC